jgi:hypothetical protein
MNPTTQRFFAELSKQRPAKIHLGKTDDLLDDIRSTLFDGSQRAIGHILDAINDLSSANDQSEENRSNYVRFTDELRNLIASLDEIGVNATDIPKIQEIVDALNEFGDEEAMRDNLDIATDEIRRLVVHKDRQYKI